MAMPSSGCIALKYCLNSCNCSSISCAVDGDAVGNISLKSLSESIGCGLPHCMREFLGYDPTPPPPVTNVTVTWCIPVSQAGFVPTKLEYCTESVGWTQFFATHVELVDATENTGYRVTATVQSSPSLGTGVGAICAKDDSANLLDETSDGSIAGQTSILTLTNVNNSTFENDYFFCGNYTYDPGS